jgi:dienelactone hydrolase
MDVTSIRAGEVRVRARYHEAHAHLDRGGVAIVLGRDGDAAAQRLTRLGVAALVVDYRTARTLDPSLEDARAALAFVRSGVLRRADPARIILVGVGAGADLALALLDDDADGRPGPPVAALVAVDPTMRNPRCWCGLTPAWVARRVGQQHRWCYTTDEALDRLAPRLPASVLGLATSGLLAAPVERLARRVGGDLVQGRGHFWGQPWWCDALDEWITRTTQRVFK